MRKLYHSVIGTILGASMFALSGCGGSDSDVSTAYLVDSNVSGVNYTCGTQSGTTGTDGSFKYQHGQTCTFSIGATQFSVTADKLAAGKSITPYDVFAGDDEKVVNLARFLQTLDSDGNTTNGITITEQVRSQITSQISFGSDFDTNVTATMTQLRAQVQTMANRELVSPATAIGHMAKYVSAPTAYTAFERIAEIDASTIATASNSSDKTVQARYVAQKIAKYFNDNIDTNISSPGDWVLGGAPATMAGNPDSNITHYNPYILEIPSPDGTKTMIVEACNKTHAGLAMSMGAGHSPALPCEIAVYTDAAAGKIYVDILDPVGSFAMFFNDLGSNPALTAMALQVKTEIKLIVYKGLSNASITHTKKATPMGASFSAAEVAAMDNQYLTLTYDINTSAGDWNASGVPANALKAANKLISKMTVNIPFGYTSAYVTSPNIATGTYGINGTDLNNTLVGNVDYNLSSDAYWRSARLVPLNVPRSTNSSDGFIYTVEACSPTHAKTALSVGGDSRDHATALPCQMSFYIDSSSGIPKLKVVFLNPTFMFETLFKDKMAGLSADQKTALGTMAQTVTNDLVNLTRYTMDNSGLNWIVPNKTATAQ